MPDTTTLPASPDGIQWHSDGPRDVSEWRYLGTRFIRGYEVEFRARLERWGEPGAWTIEPIIQDRGFPTDEWSDGVHERNLNAAAARVGALIRTIEPVVEAR